MKPNTTRSIFSYWLPAILASAILLGSGAFLSQWLAANDRQLIAFDLAAQQAQQRIAVAQRQIDRLVSIVTSEAKRQAGDRARIGARIQLAEQGAAQVFAAGTSQIDESIEPPLTYSGLTLLNQAEQQQRITRLEYFAPKGGPGQLICAAPIMPAGADKPSGLLLAYFPLTTLEQELAATGPFSGYLGLSQVTDKGSLSLFSQGELQADAGPTESRDLSGSLFRIDYQVQYTTSSADLLQLLIWPVLFLAITGLLWVLGQMQSRALRADHAQILETLDQMVNDHPPPPALPVNFRESNALLDYALRLLAQAKSAKAATQPSPPTRQAAKPKLAKSATAESAASSPAARQAASKPPAAPQAAHADPNDQAGLPAEIFRAYDIRGRVESQLTPASMQQLGLAIGTLAQERGEQTLLVARDGRKTSEAFCTALIRGLTASGRDVVDLGLVPAPVLYFGINYLASRSGVVVTASHSPKDFNGVKIVIAGQPLVEQELMTLRDRIQSGKFASGQGTHQNQDLVPDYLKRIQNDISLARRLKVVLDCANGAAGTIAPALFQLLGCEVVELFSEINGNFPNHPPDPSQPENLRALQEKVVECGADLGLAFDGDGDRLGVVDNQGKIIWPDQVLALLAEDVLARQPGADIVFDVKCSAKLSSEILKAGGRPVMWKSGHTRLKQKLQETGAPLAGAYGGHIMFGERWYGFEDALYAGARLLEVLALDRRPAADFFAAFPDTWHTPELRLLMPERQAHILFKSLYKSASNLKGVRIVTLDGLRIEMAGGWGLVRPSNTLPALTFRFEADREEKLDEVKGFFGKLVTDAWPEARLPF
jgi:phosphomannomutase/phosphoglucomutase